MEEIVVIKNCRHIPHVEKPAMFNRIVLRFLMRTSLIPATQASVEKPATSNVILWLWQIFFSDIILFVAEK